jgi:hypothetical protein
MLKASLTPDNQMIFTSLTALCIFISQNAFFSDKNPQASRFLPLKFPLDLLFSIECVANKVETSKRTRKEFASALDEISKSHSILLGFKEAREVNAVAEKGWN